MMGPAHSLSGAMAWLGVGAAAAAAGHAMPWPVLLVGALISAGAALAPDLDHKPATISTSFGPISQFICGVVEKIAHAVYQFTRMKGDPSRDGGHRTLTHTWVWAVLVGAGASALAVLGGRWAVLAILFIHVVLAINGLLWRAAKGKSNDILVWLLAAAAAWILAQILDEPGNGSHWLFAGTGQAYVWLGLPIVLGALVHDIGDALTVSGCPILWPIPIARRRWYPLGTPKAMRFKAGAWVEVKVLMPAFVVVGAASALLALQI